MADFTKDEYRALAKKTANERLTAGARERARHLQLAEPLLHRLTKDPKWDAYLKLLEPRRQDLSKMLDGVNAKITQGYASDEEVSKLRLQGKYLQGALESLEEAMRLPEGILEDAALLRASGDLATDG